jgi:predicted enzyme related to lactoylglutathione lyase
MFKGLRTVIYHVNDLNGAKAWYSSVLGIQPYFDQPFYVGFNVGGFELGLDPDMTGITAGTGSVSAYWGVSDCEATVKRLLELGASSHSPVQEVGDSIRVASVIDPFGNVLGVIENPNFSIDATR